MHDLIIAGGGPAGLSAAIMAAQRGLDAVVVDPHPGVIDKACGEGLMPGAVVELCTARQRYRLLVPERIGVIGETPLAGWRLPVGSHLLRLRAPGRIEVCYPVCIERGGHWHGLRPGGDSPAPIYLPRPDEVDSDEVYVPAGWFLSGEPTGPLRRVWLDGFCIQRNPVTNAEWIRWLNTLLDEGREEEARRCLPRDRGSRPHTDGEPLIGMRDGRFVLKEDPDGDSWEPDVPVVMLRFSELLAYAADQHDRTGLPWRLPFELEWEKAARGVDGRACPWGNTPDPAWANTLHSTSGRPLPATVDRFETDASSYGVRGMGGNISDWCLDIFGEEPPPITEDGLAILNIPPSDASGYRSNRGGCWVWSHIYSRAGLRFSHPPDGRTAEIGVRLVRPLVG